MLKVSEIVIWISELDKETLCGKNKAIVKLFLSIVKLNEELIHTKDESIKELKHDEYDLKKRELMYPVFPERRR